MKESADYIYEIADGAATIIKYRGEHQQVLIPEEIDGFPVRVIAQEAFAENGGELESVTVPSSVRELGDGVFKFCLGLQELNLSEGLEVLGTDVVLVTPISELYIPSTVHTIKNPHELGGLKLNISPENPYYDSDGYGLYEKLADGKKLLAVDLRGESTSYRIPDGTRIIGQGAFCGQESIEEVWCPSSLRVIEDEGFESCRKLKTIHFNDGLEEIGVNAFSYCALTGEVKLPASLKKIGEGAFTNTFDWDRYVDAVEKISVETINTNDAVANEPHFVTDHACLYERCDDGTLKIIRYFGKDITYRISEKVSRIGTYAFRRSLVKEVTIPASVKCIGNRAFWENQNLLALNLLKDETKVYICRTPMYRKNEITDLLKADITDRCFDYQGYDRLWDTYLYVEDQAGMASFRLKYPHELAEEQENFYRNWLLEHLTEVMEDVAAREDRARLAEFTEISLFNSANIDEAIDVLNRQQKTELLGFLMEYKENHLEADDFDFSL